MDLPSFPDKCAIYVRGGVVEDVDAGIQGTLALGFWFEDTSDIGEFYAGAEIDREEGLGVTGIAWARKGDKDDFKTDEGINLKYAKVIFIGIDVGIDDGVEAEELYVFAGHLEKYPSFQPGVYDNMLVITKIDCEDQHSSDGFRDDVHFPWTVDEEDQEYRWPYWNDAEMDEDNIPKIKPGPVMKFNDNATSNCMSPTMSAIPKNSATLSVWMSLTASATPIQSIVMTAARTITARQSFW